MHQFIAGLLIGLGAGGTGFYFLGKSVGAKLTQAGSNVKQAAKDLTKGL